MEPQTTTIAADPERDMPAETQEQEVEQEAVEQPEPATDAEAVQQTPDAAEPAPADAGDELRREIAMLREHDEAVRDKADEVANLEEEWEEAKLVTSARKKALDEAAHELRKLCQSRPSFGPLFEKPAAAPGDDEPIQAVLDSPAPTTDANAYKAVPIGALGAHGVTLKMVDRLLDAKITTLGKLGELSSRDGLAWFQDVKGIGEAAARKIEDAFSAWCMANRHLCEARPIEGTDETPALLLIWRERDEGVLEADSAMNHEDGGTLVYQVLTERADLHILGGDEQLVEVEIGYATVEEAKAEAERLEGIVRADMETVAAEAAAD